MISTKPAEAELPILRMVMLPSAKAPTFDELRMSCS